MQNKKTFLNTDTLKPIDFEEEKINKIGDKDETGKFPVFLTDGNMYMCAEIPEDIAGAVKENIDPESPPPQDEGKNPKLSDIASTESSPDNRVKVTLKSGDSLIIPDAELA